MRIQGPATLTFDDEEVFQVTIDLESTDGVGRITSENALGISMKAVTNDKGLPILAHPELKVRVNVSAANGTVILKTSGRPL